MDKETFNAVCFLVVLSVFALYGIGKLFESFFKDLLDFISQIVELRRLDKQIKELESRSTTTGKEEGEQTVQK